MKGPILERKEAYRRGLVLGFTMAEIVIMVLFCLLLITTLAFRETLRLRTEVSKSTALISQLETKNRELARVEEAIQKLTSSGRRQPKIDDLFIELRLAQGAAAELAELRKFKEANEHNASDLEAVLEEVGVDKTTANYRDELKRRVKASQEFEKVIRDSLTQGGINESSPAVIAAAARLGLSSYGAEVDCEANKIESERLRGQLKNAQNMLRQVGRGTEMPACWADPQTGKPEYIFKIELTSKGLIVQDQKLAHRAADQARLPLAGIVFGQETNPIDFISQTAPLFSWSVDNECRFFVIVQDRTAPGEKDIYKSMLRTLEHHFYKLLLN